MVKAARQQRSQASSNPGLATGARRVSSSSTDARVWLRENGYEDVAKMIDNVMLAWDEAGTGNRKNWWDVLAGRAAGRPRVIGGVEFPVLASAQRRQNRPVTANAIQRSKRENPPPVRESPRWPGT